MRVVMKWLCSDSTQGTRFAKAVELHCRCFRKICSDRMCHLFSNEISMPFIVSIKKQISIY